jgi:hypothetical protein
MSNDLEVKVSPASAGSMDTKYGPGPEVQAQPQMVVVPPVTPQPAPVQQPQPEPQVQPPQQPKPPIVLTLKPTQPTVNSVVEFPTPVAAPDPTNRSSVDATLTKPGKKEKVQCKWVNENTGVPCTKLHDQKYSADYCQRHTDILEKRKIKAEAEAKHKPKKSTPERSPRVTPEADPKGSNEPALDLPPAPVILDAPKSEQPTKAGDEPEVILLPPVPGKKAEPQIPNSGVPKENNKEQPNAKQEDKYDQVQQEAADAGVEEDPLELEIEVRYLIKDRGDRLRQILPIEKRTHQDAKTWLRMMDIAEKNDMADSVLRKVVITCATVSELAVNYSQKYFHLNNFSGKIDCSELSICIAQLREKYAEQASHLMTPEYRLMALVAQSAALSVIPGPAPPFTFVPPSVNAAVKIGPPPISE